MRVLTYLRFVKGLSVKRSTLFYRSYVLYNSYVRLCANIFGVGLESDGEALTDRGCRPWG